ncbi:MAG: hypothetical protein ABIS67_13275 [Candidatus Eisenbacteria bacterium]
MSIHPRSHLPVSARHAFALAFDLAVRRDWIASLAVPLLLRAPWILIPALLQPLDHADLPLSVYAASAAALIVDYLLLLTTGSMMRFRARSVFNTPVKVHPEPALSCYAKALRRLPWLFVTEVVRNLVIFFATFLFVVPGLFLGFRLSLATETVVLDEKNLPGAFERSFHLTDGRFERWLEMVSISAFVALGLILFMTVIALVFPAPGFSFWFAAMSVALTLVTAVIQYAWTFFYLRLVEIESPIVEEGPLLAGAGAYPPRLVVIEPDSPEVRNSATPEPT